MARENAVIVAAVVLCAILGKPLFVLLVTAMENASIAMARVSALIVAVQGKDRE